MAFENWSDTVPSRTTTAALMTIALAAALPASANAQATQYLFTGTFLVTAATKSCGNMVGDSRVMYYATVLWNMKTADKVAKPGFVLVNPNGTVVIVPQTATFKKAGEYELTQVDRWNGVATPWTSTYSDLKFTPSTIDATTTQVTITGKLNKLNFDPACTVTFRAVGLRNP
jgi:hypothetical protein